MRWTRTASSPVVTLLSPSPCASRRAQEIFGSIFGLQDVSNSVVVDDDDDALNAKFKSSFGSMSWDSVVSQCRHSGALLHWLSVEGKNNSSHGDQKGGSFSLLGISRRTTCTEHDNSNLDVMDARNLVTSNSPSSMLSMKLRHFFRRPMTADVLLQRHQGLPVLDLPAVVVGDEEATSSSAGSTTKKDHATTTYSRRLKEVAFTMYDDATYEDGSTVLGQLSQSALLRPVTGLYEWPTATSNDGSSGGGVYLRPLPAAKRDLRGSARALVLTFHCDSLEQVIQDHQSDNSNNNLYSLSKIGFTGQGNGQLRIQAAATTATEGASSNNSFNPLNGLDLRWCERRKPTSAFPEAQESLLASSLPELQSPNVLKSTGKDQPGEDDAKIGSSDCWVEVRTMVQNPRGFAPTTNKGPKVATAPPSYPE